MTAEKAIQIIRRSNSFWRVAGAVARYEVAAEKAGRKPSPKVREAFNKRIVPVDDIHATGRFVKRHNMTHHVRNYIRKNPGSTVTEIAKAVRQVRAYCECRVHNLWKQGEVGMKRVDGVATFTMLKRRGPRHKAGYGTRQQRKSRRHCWRGKPVEDRAAIRKKGSAA